jgi:hypothetical protein
MMRRRRQAPQPTREGLTLEERAALERLATVDGCLRGSRWLVGRVLAQSLARQGLVFAYSEFVLLSDAGWGALITDRERSPKGIEEPT